METHLNSILYSARVEKSSHCVQSSGEILQSYEEM